MQIAVLFQGIWKIIIIISNSKPSSISLNNLTFVLKTSPRSNTVFAWGILFGGKERSQKHTHTHKKKNVRKKHSNYSKGMTKAIISQLARGNLKISLLKM